MNALKLLLHSTSISAKVLLVAFLLVVTAGPSKASDWYGKLVGGSGGATFSARCDQGEYLVGIEARVGLWFDAVRPLCAKPGGRLRRFVTQFGGDGGEPRDVTCPSESPVITYLDVVANGPKTIVVDHLQVRCGIYDENQLPLSQRTPLRLLSGCDPKEIEAAVCGSGEGRPNLRIGSAECPVGLLAVGLYGRYGDWLDALGLICAEAPTPEAPPIPPVSGTPLPDCPPPKVRAVQPPHACECPPDALDAACVGGGVLTQEDLKRLPKGIILGPGAR
jgi:hypothetical protein